MLKIVRNWKAKRAEKKRKEERNRRVPIITFVPEKKTK